MLLMNKVVWKGIVLSGILLLYPVQNEAFAQAVQDSLLAAPDSVGRTIPYLSQYDENNLLEVTIPPLETLTESALRNSPNRAALQKNIEIRKTELKTANLEWVRYIGASANYGMSNATNMSSAPDIFAPQGQMYRTSQSNYYSVGASVTLPLFTILDWKNKVKMRKASIEQAEEYVAQFEQDLKREILAFYNDALLALALLKGKAQAMELAGANMISIEQDFTMGKVGTESLTLAKQNQMRLMDEFENTKAKLRSSLMTLELLCGMKMYDTGQ